MTTDRGERGRARWFRNLPMFWKLQIPFAALLLIVGVVGGVLIIRGLASQAQSRFEADLQRASLDARGVLLARELYLLESANLAANLEGMATAMAAGDTAEVDRLLQTVLALKGDLDVVSVVGAGGVPLVSYTGTAPAELPPETTAVDFVTTSLGDGAGDRRAGLLPGSRALPATIAIAAPVCEVLDGCVPAGAAVVGVTAQQLTTELAAAALDIAADGAMTGGVAIYDDAGQQIAGAGTVPVDAADVALPDGQLLRRSETVAGDPIQVLYAPFEVQAQPRGLVAVTLPEDVALGGVRDAARTLVILLLLSLVGIVGIGALLSRLVVGAMRPVLATNKRLGAGDLTARAPVIGDDEVGELARGLNLMAEELQASYETLESRVEQRTAEVRRLLEERTQFFAALSHELRTPLAIIISEAQLLADIDDDEAKESGEAIEDSASGLLGSVNDILEIARAEAGKLELDLCPTDLAAIVGAAEPTARALSRGSGVEFTAEVDRRTGVVEADPARMREVLINLLDNAVKYTPSGGRVHLRCAQEGEAAVIEVTDTGMGIPDGIGDDLFKPFFRVPGNTPGHGKRSSGLGMALTKQLVEAHGGQISYRSTVGKGTTFTVRLPRAAPRRRLGRT